MSELLKLKNNWKEVEVNSLIKAASPAIRSFFFSVIWGPTIGLRGGHKSVTPPNVLQEILATPARAFFCNWYFLWQGKKKNYLSHFTQIISLAVCVLRDNRAAGKIYEQVFRPFTATLLSSVLWELFWTSTFSVQILGFGTKEAGR